MNATLHSNATSILVQSSRLFLKSQIKKKFVHLRRPCEGNQSKNFLDFLESFYAALWSLKDHVKAFKARNVWTCLKDHMQHYEFLKPIKFMGRLITNTILCTFPCGTGLKLEFGQMVHICNVGTTIDLTQCITYIMEKKVTTIVLPGLYYGVYVA